MGATNAAVSALVLLLGGVVWDVSHLDLLHAFEVTRMALDGSMSVNAFRQLTLRSRAMLDCKSMGRTVYVLHSAIAANTVAEALRRSIDEEHWTLFSLSGYRGNRPLLGEVRENTFRLQKRRYSRNDFAGHFYARFEPEVGGGTSIEGYFDAPRWARYFMRIWLAGAVLIGIPIFLETLVDIITGSHHMSGDLWVGLIVPPALVLFGTVLPKFSRRLGKKDRQFILEHMQQTLAARIEGSELQFEGALRRG